MWRRGLQLPCYEGDKPFVYACFAGVDKRRVYPYLRQLQDRRFRISFFDDASPDGAEAQRIAARIAKAQLVLLFFSERANHVPIWRYQVWTSVSAAAGGAETHPLCGCATEVIPQEPPFRYNEVVQAIM